MNRTEYYNQMKELARQTRKKYGLTTPRVLKSHLRAIYKDQGIHIDIWKHPLREVRGAYFNDDLGPTVLLANGLPDDPTIFTMAHELKHHLVDSKLPIACCSDRNQKEYIEIGAEIFAAEIIYPEQDFINHLKERKITLGNCTPETIARLKHDTQTTLSYSGLAKRAMFLGFAPEGSLNKIRWKKLEESIYGEPKYKQYVRWRKGIN